jgi:hypothetical protein
MKKSLRWLFRHTVKRSGRPGRCYAQAAVQVPFSFPLFFELQLVLDKGYQGLLGLFLGRIGAVIRSAPDSKKPFILDAKYPIRTKWHRS